jgi:transcription-repair coupling factor (superfamily II helicase)
MKQGKLIGYFIQDQQSQFYQSDAFTSVLKFVQMHSDVCKMKEKQTRNGLRLLITFHSIQSTKDALDTLSKINEQ